MLCRIPRLQGSFDLSAVGIKRTGSHGINYAVCYTKNARLEHFHGSCRVRSACDSGDGQPENAPEVYFMSAAPQWPQKRLPGEFFFEQEGQIRDALLPSVCSGLDFAFDAAPRAAPPFFFFA